MWIWPTILAAGYFITIHGYAAVYYFFESLWPKALTFVNDLKAASRLLFIKS